MAQYTMQLNELVGRLGFNVFDDTWSTYDQAHKKELCDKILSHYWFYEIGAETPDRFKFYLNCQLREIMPYYNMLYETAIMDMLPLYNHYVETENTLTGERSENRQKVDRRDKFAVSKVASSIKTIMDTVGNQNTVNGTTGKRDWTEDDTRHLSENETTNTTRDKTIKETETITTDTTADTTGTSDETKNDTWDRTTKTTTDQDTTSTSTDNKTQWHSDTPQGEIVNDQLQVTLGYLTTYDRATDSLSTKGTLDETVNGEENYKGTTTTDLDTTENLVKKEVTEREKDIAEKETTNTTRNLTADETINKQYHETYSEDFTGDVTTKENETGTRFEEHQTDTTNNELGSEGEDTKADEKRKQITIAKGNLNVTRTELIRKYRENYMNIDLLIIEALANNFMGVF